jgi:hypothetical protein
MKSVVSQSVRQAVTRLRVDRDGGLGGDYRAEAIGVDFACVLDRADRAVANIVHHHVDPVEGGMRRSDRGFSGYNWPLLARSGR